MDAGGPGRATPEDYRELVLHGWYLEAPFSVLDEAGTGDVEAPGHAHLETSLRHACPALAASGDVDRFVRSRER